MSGETSHRRRDLGPLATAARVAVGLGLIYFVGAADGGGWDVGADDLVIGLVALPVITVVLGLIARRYATGPIRFTGLVGHTVNFAIIAALALNPVTGGGAGLFYAGTMLIAAWRGQGGCETTVISNLVLRRNDQVGCAFFAPIDLAERKHPRHDSGKMPA